MENIPYLGVIIAIFVNQFIGALWYSPRLFGLAWAKAQHLDMSKMKALPKHYVGAIFIGVVLVLCITIIQIMLGISSIETALLLGFLMWLGFVATSHFSQVVWAKKSLTVFMIETGYFLVITLLTSIIIVSFR